MPCSFQKCNTNAHAHAEVQNAPAARQNPSVAAIKMPKQTILVRKEQISKMGERGPMKRAQKANEKANCGVFEEEIGFSVAWGCIEKSRIMAETDLDLGRYLSIRLRAAEALETRFKSCCYLNRVRLDAETKTYVLMRACRMERWTQDQGQ